MYNRHDNLNGGTVRRLRAMRTYRDDWNAKQESGERRYAARSALAPGLVGALQARSHGVGSIRSDAHGPHVCDDGRRVTIPACVLDGLRDVGHVDELYPRLVDHRGWFADADQDETYRGHVWQLPAARDGSPRFIAGYTERDSGYAVLCCSDGRIEIFTGDKPQEEDGAAGSEACRDAARAADRLAERDAETEREYSERWQEASRASDERDDARNDSRKARARFRTLAKAYRATRADDLAALMREAREEARAAVETMQEKTEHIESLDMTGEF